MQDVIVTMTTAELEAKRADRAWRPPSDDEGEEQSCPTTRDNQSGQADTAQAAPLATAPPTVLGFGAALTALAEAEKQKQTTATPDGSADADSASSSPTASSQVPGALTSVEVSGNVYILITGSLRSHAQDTSDHFEIARTDSGVSSESASFGGPSPGTLRRGMSRVSQPSFATRPALGLPLWPGYRASKPL